jgi:hypothetical protein
MCGWKFDINDQDKKRIKIEFHVLLKVWYKLPKINIWWKYSFLATTQDLNYNWWL